MKIRILFGIRIRPKFTIRGNTESHQKKKVKKIHNKWEVGGGGQQILVCEPQKSAFLEVIFQKHVEINS